MPIDENNKTCILVIGMHRSGTSATAGVLKILGVDLGQDLIEGYEYNAKGCFEHRDTIVANQKILDFFDAGGYSKNLLPQDWQNNSVVLNYKNEIERKIIEDFSVSNIFAIKDPHLSILLPVVLDILQKNKINVKVIICKRNNLEIVKSLVARDGISGDSAYELCKKYNKYIATYKETLPVEFLEINFDDLLEKTNDTINQITNFLPQIPKRFEDARDGIYQFLDASLKHHSLKKDGILISVVTPCYNDGKYLKESLDPIIAISDLPLEIVIVDDGSNDESTLTILNSYKNNARIKLIRQMQQGPSVARNVGIRKASGKYILPLDADNIVDPDYIYKSLAILENNAEVDIVYSDCKFFGLNNALNKVGNFNINKLVINNFIDTCAVLRKSIWEKCGGYDENLSGLEDWEFWINAYEKGAVFYYLEEPLFSYRVKNDAESFNVRCQQKGNDAIIREYVYKKHALLLSRIIQDDNCKIADNEVKQNEINKSKEEKIITSQKNVTVIVPVFNGWELVKKCIESLEKFTDKRHSIIIINDCSTDQGIKDNILKKINNLDNFSYKENSRNLGFVKTCNKAVFEYDKTNNDVLLLNSDTEVTENYLEEMLCVLYDHDKHGIVCPRSNNATLLTIPIENAMNGTARFFDPQKSYQLWSKIKEYLPRYSVIPTSMGFCMLIKRDLINNFGLFDEIYSPGYNEENDFTCRINKYGYSPIQANRAFVYHKEGISFGDKKNELEEKHSKILNSRYPEYSRKVREYFEDLNPIELLTPVFFKEKPKFLYYLSDLAPIYNGTTIGAMKLWQYLYPKLREKFEVYLYIPKHTYLFFKDNFGDCQNVIFEGDKIEDKFNLVYKPYQIFTLADLCLINKISLKFVFNILDIISLRCEYLKSKERYEAIKQSINFADGLICNSEHVKNDVEKYFNENIHAKIVFPYAVETDNCLTNKLSQGILIIGNSFSHKLIPETLDVLIGKELNLKISVLGMASNNEYPQINFYSSGSLSPTEIESLYRSANIIIFPSQYEGFGIPLLEASKYHRPIIVHNNSCTREVAGKLNLNNVFFYDLLEEIPGIVKNISTDYQIKSDHNRHNWNKISNDIFDYLWSVHVSPVNGNKLKKRFDYIRMIEKENGKTNDQSNKINSVNYNCDNFIIRLFDIFLKTLFVLFNYPKFIIQNPKLLKSFFQILFRSGPYKAFQNAYDFLQLAKLRKPDNKSTKETNKILMDDANKYHEHIVQREKLLFNSENLKNEAEKFKNIEKISIITLVDNTNFQNWLYTLATVKNQIFDNWEWIIGVNIKSKKLIDLINSSNNDKNKIKIKYLEGTNYYNQLLSESSGDYFCLLNTGDSLSPDALLEAIKLIYEKKADLIYSDEDRRSNEHIYNLPFFKPDWSPDLHLSFNYINRFALYKKNIIIECGGVENDFEKYPDYDLALKITEKTKNIAHIPKILYHRFSNDSVNYFETGNDERDYIEKKSLQNAIKRRGIRGFLAEKQSPPYYLHYNFSPSLLASIIMPAKNNAQLTKKCLQSILEKTSYQNYEILIVDNGSTELETLNYYDRIRKFGSKKIRLLSYDNQFNFSKINNFAAKKANGEILVFLNNDTEIINENWLTALIEQAQRPEIGAVGCKLYYPNGSLQHAGVFDWSKHAFTKKSDVGCYFELANSIVNYRTLTGACLAVKKSLFEEIGGFNEIYQVPFSDTEFCLQLYLKGYLNIFTPLARLYHLEAATRGIDNWPKETAVFRERWKDIINEVDPYYNPNLNSNQEKSFEWRGY